MSDTLPLNLDLCQACGEKSERFEDYACCDACVVAVQSRRSLRRRVCATCSTPFLFTKVKKGPDGDDGRYCQTCHPGREKTLAAHRAATEKLLAQLHTVAGAHEALERGDILQQAKNALVMAEHAVVAKRQRVATLEDSRRLRLPRLEAERSALLAGLTAALTRLEQLDPAAAAELTRRGGAVVGAPPQVT